MMKLKITFLLLSIYSFVSAQIDYTLKMSNPQSHYFEVEMTIKNIKEKEIEVKMPVWAPGSYLVRDFSKNVNLVKAFDEKGNTLMVEKTKKNAWKVKNGTAKNIRVQYEVYAFELTVRTSFLDLTHGFVSGTGVFMYSEKYRNQSGKLTIVPHPTFSTITTSLEQKGEGVASDGAQTFVYADYDELADCPIEIGNQKVFEFSTSGCKHTVAMYGEANYNVDQLKKDMAKIVDASTAIFGENPNKNYVFIIHNVTDGQGGLEHKNSTTLSVNRFTYSPDKYVRFLTLVAHEYFHLWNVKRIRAKELGPFNYDEEVYTPLLYVMEGFTSYYEDLIVYKAGFIDENSYLGTIQAAVNHVEGSVGSKVQPLSHASFDAWIKAYKPNENSSNTTMTYYTRGGLVASLMDALIIDKFNGKKTLDDFMRLLYQKYYKTKDTGFTNAEFESDFSKFMEEDMNWFFAKYVHGTETPDYAKIFGAMGIKVEDVSKESPSLGIAVGGDGVVKIVRSGSAAEKAGLSVNDEIIAINGNRVAGSQVSETIGALAVGEEVKILVSRDNIILELKAKNELYKKQSYKFSLTENAVSDPKARALFRL
ncbi:MAG: M61 family metallopeptidase [Flavobacteriia bacterium]|nr:M61 family metallopeptidase [Flavobacteriia bacterium]OJX39244.1 MAG: hypothetical protein BGO87_04465 [Flavobacteriia bacterium 40-80]